MPLPPSGKRDSKYKETERIKREREKFAGRGKDIRIHRKKELHAERCRDKPRPPRLWGECNGSEWWGQRKVCVSSRELLM